MLHATEWPKTILCYMFLFVLLVTLKLNDCPKNKINLKKLVLEKVVFDI